MPLKDRTFTGSAVAAVKVLALIFPAALLFGGAKLKRSQRRPRAAL